MSHDQALRLFKANSIANQLREKDSILFGKLEEVAHKEYVEAVKCGVIPMVDDKPVDDINF